MKRKKGMFHFNFSAIRYKGKKYHMKPFYNQ